MLQKIDFDKAYDDGRVFRNESPCGNYHLYNYKPETQFKGDWDTVTMNSRGIVFDKNTGKIAARPFRKFFNINEKYAEIGDDTFDVKLSLDKLDGSLGIIWYDVYQNRWRVTTRGSFSSEQAIKAEEIFYRSFSNEEIELFPKDITILVEILYKDNRIVVNYGDDESLMFLTAIDSDSGWEYLYINSDEIMSDMRGYMVGHVYEPFQKRNWIPSQYAFDETSFFSDEVQLQLAGKEGVVITWYNKQLGYSNRVKLKTEEYVRLHRIRFDLLNPHRVWEYLHAGYTADTIATLLTVEDEQFDALKKLADDIMIPFKNEEKKMLELWDKLCILFEGKNPTRKDWAMEIIQTPYKSELFALLDGKDYYQILMKKFEP